MPRVPEIRQERVQEQRLSTTNLSPANFGGAEVHGKIGRAIAQNFDTMTRLVAAEKAKADNIKVMESEQKLAQHQEQLLWDPKTGFYNKRGKDAMPASNEAIESFNDKVKEIEGELQNETQRAAFKKVSFRWGEQFNNGVLRYSHREKERAAFELTKASVEFEKQNAVQNYGDVKAVGTSLAAIHEKNKKWKESQGLDDEWLKNKQTADTSEVHTKIIQAKVTDRDYIGAKSYYENVKKTLIGHDVVRAKELVQNGSVRGMSQQIADQIMGSDKFLSMKDALAKAREVKDPEVRDAVVARVTNRFKENAAILEQEKEAMYLQAEDFLKNSKEIPVAIWTSLDPKHQETLAKYGNNQANDPARYAMFRQLTADQLASMSKSEFQRQYWVHFDAQHRRKADSLYEAANGNPAEYTRTMNYSQILKDGMVKTGLVDKPSVGKWSKKEYKQFQLLQEKADEQLELFEIEQGRKATQKEQQAIVDELTLKTVYQDEWFRDSKVPAFLVDSENEKDLYVPLSEIPALEKAAMENYIRSMSSFVTDEKIERAYAAMRIGRRDLVDKIIKGE